MVGFRAFLGCLEGKLKAISGKSTLKRTKSLHNEGLGLIFVDNRGQIIQFGIQQYTKSVTECG